MAETRSNSGFDESEHPRNKDGTFKSKGLTDVKKNATLKIGKVEMYKLTKKIDAQFYMYAGKKHGAISSYELNARYEFDIIGFGTYIITSKEPLE